MEEQKSVSRQKPRGVARQNPKPSPLSSRAQQSSIINTGGAKEVSRNPSTPSITLASDHPCKPSPQFTLGRGEQKNRSVPLRPAVPQRDHEKTPKSDHGSTSTSMMPSNRLVGATRGAPVCPSRPGASAPRESQQRLAPPRLQALKKNLQRTQQIVSGEVASVPQIISSEHFTELVRAAQDNKADKISSGIKADKKRTVTFGPNLEGSLKIDSTILQMVSKAASPQYCIAYKEYIANPYPLERFLLLFNNKILPQGIDRGVTPIFKQMIMNTYEGRTVTQVRKDNPEKIVEGKLAQYELKIDGETLQYPIEDSTGQAKLIPVKFSASFAISKDPK